MQTTETDSNDVWQDSPGPDLEQCVIGSTNVKDIEHLRWYFLRWFGHFKRMNVQSLTSRVYEKRMVENTKRPKKIWEEMVKHDMRKRNLSVKDINDGEKWRRCCRQLDDSNISDEILGLNSRRMENDNDVHMTAEGGSRMLKKGLPQATRDNFKATTENQFNSR